MAGEGDIIAGLGLDMSDFSAGLDGALDLAKKFVSSFVSMMTTGVEKSFSKVRDEFRQSGNFDITTKQMQQLRFAADQSGTAFGTMEMALRRIGKTAGEATFGSKSALSQMARLGLDPKQFAMASLYDQAILVAKSMEGITNASQRMAIYSKIAGRSGIEVAQMFKELSKDTDTFHRIALGVSEISGAKIYYAKEALGEVSAILEDIYNQIAAKISPVITNVVALFEEWGFTGVRLQSTIDLIGSAWVTTTKYTVAALMTMYDVAREVASGLYTVFKFAFFDPILLHIDFLSKVFKWTIDGLNSASETFKEVATNAVNAIISGFFKMGNITGPIFVNMARGFENAFRFAIDTVGGWINTLIRGFNKTALLNPFGTQIPEIPKMPTGSVISDAKKYDIPKPFAKEDLFGKSNAFGNMIAPGLETALKSLSAFAKGIVIPGLKMDFGKNLDKVSSFIDSLFKSDLKAREKGDNHLSIGDDSKQKNTPTGYALNVTNQRASLAAMRMAFTPVQEVHDNAVVAAVAKVEAKIPAIHNTTTPFHGATLAKIASSIKSVSNPTLDAQDAAYMRGVRSSLGIGVQGLRPPSPPSNWGNMPLDPPSSKQKRSMAQVNQIISGWAKDYAKQEQILDAIKDIGNKLNGGATTPP